MSSNENSKEGTQEAQPYSEPEYAKSQKKNADIPWYNASIDKYLVPETQRLLEEYSKVPFDQQSEHVHEIRERAWAIRKYPCTGLGIWLMPSITRSPAYNTVLEKLKKGGVILDIGCFLGGDLRQLVFNGAPSDRMFGADVVSHWQVGMDLFRDKDSFKATFIEVDLMAIDDRGKSPNVELQKLEGKVDVISIFAVLHQWDWHTQVEAVKRLIVFSKPGSLVVGHQAGKTNSEHVVNEALGVKQWRHDPKSFEKMWNVAGDDTGTKWKTQAWLRTFEDMKWDPADSKFLGEDARIIDFVITRFQ